MKKKITALMICMVMVLALMPVLVNAEETTSAAATEITSVEVEFAEPVVGEKPATADQVKLPEDANYEVLQIRWLECENSEFEGTEDTLEMTAETFEAGKYYGAVVFLKEKDGYTFAEDIGDHATLNGGQPDNAVYGYFNMEGDPLMGVSQVWGPLEEAGPDVPKTGDAGNWLVWGALALAAAGAVIVICRKKTCC